jgi:ankyrin repeat protein
MYAVANGRADVVKALVDHEAHLEAHTPEGLTVLMAAAQKGKLDVLKVLLGSKRTKVNAKTDGGQTALMYAAAAGNADAVRALLAAGADASIADGQGLTALKIAEAKGKKDAAKLLAR